MCHWRQEQGQMKFSSSSDCFLLVPYHRETTIFVPMVIQAWWLSVTFVSQDLVVEQSMSLYCPGAQEMQIWMGGKENGHKDQEKNG